MKYLLFAALLLLAACGGHETPPLKITPVSSLPDATVGYDYQFQLHASGGVEPYRWEMAQDTVLPPGLELDADTGELSGKPLAEASGFDGKPKVWDVAFRVTDTAGNTAILNETSQGSEQVQ